MNLLPQMVRRDRRLSLSCCCRGRRARSRLLAHRADKAETLARDRADDVLLFATVADRLAHRRDAAAQRRFGDNAPAPDRGDDIVLGDNTVAVLKQIDKEIKDLRLDLNLSRAAPQLAAADVERIVSENELHGCPASGYPPALTE